jgi:hypothetical protein
MWPSLIEFHFRDNAHHGTRIADECFHCLTATMFRLMSCEKNKAMQKELKREGRFQPARPLQMVRETKSWVKRIEAMVPGQFERRIPPAATEWGMGIEFWSGLVGVGRRGQE